MLGRGGKKRESRGGVGRGDVEEMTVIGIFIS